LSVLLTGMTLVTRWHCRTFCSIKTQN